MIIRSQKKKKRRDKMASNAYNLEDFVRRLDGWGLTDVMLPFLLIFTVMYAVLLKTRALGENKKNFNVIIALCIALIVVIPHVLGVYPENKDAVSIMNKALPAVSLLVVAFLMVLVMIGIWGGEARWLGTSLSGWIVIGSFILILIIFGAAAGWWGTSAGTWGWFTRFFGADAVAIIIMLLVFGIIIWFITKEDSAEKKTGDAASHVLKEIGQSFMPKGK
jgi:hypothetical protein